MKKISVLLLLVCLVACSDKKIVVTPPQPVTPTSAQTVPTPEPPKTNPAPDPVEDTPAPLAVEAKKVPFLKIIPDTTLDAEMAANTSAAASFVTQTNGNMGSAGISKINLHTLLYKGNATKIYAHVMPWFGSSGHMKVGYNSTDVAQARRQVEDMISRGIDGVIVDWYGPDDTFKNTAALTLLKEAEKHPNFTFAIMIDQGAFAKAKCDGCTPQQVLQNLVTYVEKTFVVSPAYTRISGQPMITNFDVDLNYKVDWAALTTSTKPMFIFQHTSGFTHPASGGSYEWIKITSDFDATYMLSFYSVANRNPKAVAIGAAFKGFNDTLASWTKQRVIEQQCGLTWLASFDYINKMYSAKNPLGFLQLVTWNDYEEGTEIESGIDNCVSIAPMQLGNALSWTLSQGDGPVTSQSTIDHYTIYISTDGKNLMQLKKVDESIRTLDLASLNLAPGSYTFYIKAVGKASIKNQMSPPITYVQP